MILLVPMVVFFSILEFIICFFFPNKKENINAILLFFTMAFFSFGRFFPYYPVVKKIQSYCKTLNLPINYKVISITYWLIFFLLVTIVFRIQSISFFNKLVRKVLLLLVIFNFIVLGIDYYLNFKKININQYENKFDSSFILPLDVKVKPDIYYIMVDGYPRHDIIQSYSGFNNNVFLNALEQHGFSIIRNSYSNYPGTALSLPSIFEMCYLDETSVDSRSFLEGSKVLNILKQFGYQLISISGNFGFTANSSHMFDKVKGDFILKSFTEYLLSQTALMPFLSRIGLFHKGFKVNRQFSIVQKIARIEQSPFFVFCHIMLPHLPFAFNKYGKNKQRAKPVESVNLLQKEDREDLEYQFIYLNKLLLETVAEIKKYSKTPPIIIIQSDHGMLFYQRSHRDKNYLFNPDKFILKERFSNFNALYFPNKEIPSYRTNVNTFRFIFNEYFGMHLPYKKEKCINNHTLVSNLKNNVIYLEELDNIKFPSHEEIEKLFY
jgi:hypothetical protein